MASRKGLDVILVAAGLPYSFEPAIQHDGCTYLRRSVHEELGLFTPDETRQAFRDSFLRIKGLTANGKVIDSLTRLSSGHPYMMQLLGYHLVEFLNGSLSGKAHAVSEQDVETVQPIALEAYERRALRPLVDSLSATAQEYLRAMAQVMDDTHVASTGDLAERMEKTHAQLSTTRQSLIGEGVIVTHGHGHVRFAIPYLRAYLERPAAAHDSTCLLDEWDV